MNQSVTNLVMPGFIVKVFLMPLRSEAPFGPQLVALLRAVALEDFEQRALFRALGRLEKRSQVGGRVGG